MTYEELWEDYIYNPDLIRIWNLPDKVDIYETLWWMEWWFNWRLKFMFEDMEG